MESPQKIFAVGGFESFPALPSSVPRPVADSVVEHRVPLTRGSPSSLDIAAVSASIQAAWALVASCHTNSDYAAFDVSFPETNASVLGADTVTSPTPVCIRLAQDQKISECLQAVQSQTTNPTTHKDAGLPESWQEDVQTLLVIRTQTNSSAHGVLEKRPQTPEKAPTKTYALTLEIQFGTDKIAARAYFDSRVIEPWIMPKLLERLEVIVQQLDSIDPEQPLQTIRTITPKDLQEVWDLNSKVPEPIDRCIHDIIEQQATVQPDAVAISAWDGELSYGELNQLASLLASHIVDRVEPGSLIPLCFEKSQWATVALLGVLKAGAAFVFLDPSLPEKPLQHIIHQSNTTLVLCSLLNQSLISQLDETLQAITIDANFFSKFDNDKRILPTSNPSATSYVTFSSGRTGASKGVVLSHRSAISAIFYQTDILGFTKDVRIFDFAPYSSDVSIENAFTALTTGGCLCVPNEEDRTVRLAESIASTRANTIILTPSASHAISPDDVPSLQMIIFEGEPLHVRDVEPWWGKVRVVHRYGVSESPAASTININAQTPEAAIGIGKGAGQVTWIVDPDDSNRLVAPGFTGELLLEGPLVGRGYLNDPDKTAVVFIDDPEWLLQGAAPNQPGRHGRLFKTGDLVRYNEDGSLIYISRKESGVTEAENSSQEKTPEAEQDEEKITTYWRAFLANPENEPFPALPRSVPEPAADNTIECEFLFPQDTPSVTPSLIRAAWAIVVNRQTNSDDVIFGATVSGSNSPVPVRIKPARSHRVSEFLQAVQDQATEMAPFQHVGLGRIASVSSDAQDVCKFQTLLNVQSSNHLQTWDHTQQYALRLDIQLEAEKMNVKARFDSRVLEQWSAEGLLERFEFVVAQLASVSADSKRTLGDITTVTKKDLLQIWEWNGTMPENIDRCVHKMIEDQVKIRPGASAVEAWDGQITYAELDELSNKVASQLVELGVTTNMLLPVCFEKTLWTPVAAYGVLKAGAAFVLLDPNLPEERLRTIVSTTGSNVILSSAANMELSSRLSDKQLRVVKVSPHLRELAAPTAYPGPESQSASSLMFTVFTSGSTGTPKGAMMSHEGYASCLHHQLVDLGFNSDSRVFDFASYSFDISVHNIIATFVAGGCLCIPSDNDRKFNMTKAMQSMRCTLTDLTPTVAGLLDPSTLPDLKTLILAGEAVTVNDAQRWWGKVDLVNAYGPAECNISTISCRASCPEEVSRIGRGAGLLTWVVDPQDCDRLAPPGSVGELLLEGPLVGMGYLNDPIKTAAVFINGPKWLLEGLSTDQPGRLGRLYKTGDLVTYSSDGSLTYFGRKDTQVKIRGQRVELGEVEHNVQECISFTCKVVAEVVKPGQGAGPVLAAFIETEDEAIPVVNEPKVFSISDEDMAKIKKRLPSHMVPSMFFAMRALPMTPTGKVNRKGLREVACTHLISRQGAVLNASDSTSDGSSNTAAILETEQPAFTLAKKVSEMVAPWSQSGAEQRGFSDALLLSTGLDSVNMMSLAHFVSREFGVKVGIEVLMNPTTSIRSLSAFILDSKAATAMINTQPIVHSMSVDDVIAEISKHNAKIQVAESQVSTAKQSNSLLTVFLTGASGFIGTQVLRQLLEDPSVDRVTALIRGKSDASARNRLIESATTAQWWCDVYEEKLQVWPGDLSATHLGLNSARWGTLADGRTFDVIIHNGAAVNWAKSYAALEASNVGSTVQLLELAVKAPHMRFVYVSSEWQTGSQSGQTDHGDKEEDLAKEQVDGGINGYHMTKFVCDCIVKRAALRCQSERRVGIVRPGYVIGTATEGVPTTDDYLWRLALACIQAGAYNADKANTWLSVSTSATMASTIVGKALNPEKHSQVATHVKDGMAWKQFWALIKGMGYKIEPRSGADWWKIINEQIDTLKEEHPLWTLIDLVEADVAAPADETRPAASSTSMLLKVAVRRNADFLAKVGFLPLTGARASEGVQINGKGAFRRSGL
ncbi:N-benzoylphenylalaninol synthetase apmA [Cladobotryum mycophilum]|uniref:N-benzoylphenylalaninol synthetase apmA n=1 Tax=Cladobotryum mycophilum TaxID=491253 RepID=A0ABR0S874_9HYPO